MTNRSRLVLFSSLLFNFSIGTAQTFVRELPDEKLINAITEQTFKAHDAVIILKEVSYKVEWDDKVFQGDHFYGFVTSESKFLIVKILNERAISRYGSFSYDYTDYLGEYWPGLFTVAVRVRKPDGTVKVMPETEVKRINEGRERDEFFKKVVFKIPDIEVNDVVQIEYTATTPLSKLSSAIFSFSDLDYVIYSNLYITQTDKSKFNYFSFPISQIGQPTVTQISTETEAGKTYFWGVKNVAPVRYEPYSFPFMDQALITVITPQKTNLKKTETWEEIGTVFYDSYIDDLNLSSGSIEDLGFTSKITHPSWNLADSLYAAIKKFAYRGTRWETIPSKYLDNIVEDKKGDAGDFSGLFYKILRKWGYTADFLLVRDQRQGNLELNAPSLAWFKRPVIRVHLDGKAKLYDFDAAVSDAGELPWFLVNSQALDIREELSGIETLAPNQFPAAETQETHLVRLDTDGSAKEKLSVRLTGSAAQSVRSDFATVPESELKAKFKSLPQSKNFSETDSVTINRFRQVPEVEWSISGNLNSQSEELNGFLIYRPYWNALSGLKNELYAPVRYGHIRFESPFEYRYKATVTIPAGYTLNEMPEASTFSGPAGSTGHVTYSSFSGVVELEAVLKMPSQTIANTDFGALIKFFDSMMTGVSRELVISKAK